MKLRSGYSFKTAWGHLPDVVSRLQEIGQTFAPLTDRVSTYGFARWTKLCEKAELKPIYGVEIGVVKALGEKRPSPDFWTFLAKNNLRPLHDLINLATGNPGREPSLLYKQALSPSGLFKIAGERLQVDALPLDLPADFFVALMPSTPKGLIRRCQEKGLKFVASSDNYFPRAEDEELYRVALGRRGGTQTYPRWILSEVEWRRATDHLVDRETQDSAVARLHSLAEQCNTTMKKGALLRFPKTKTLRELCLEGAIKKGVNLNSAIYSERFERELKLIAEKDFEDYFFILADMIGWAKERMIVGPARGSSCGSLVCYLLDITAIDPIPFGLIFERFIDTTRKDLPDIDVDFSDTRRHLVFEYAEQKYGKDHIARLGTVGMFQPKSAVKQAGAALRIPQWRTNKVMDSLIVRSSGDSRAMLQLEDTLNETEAGRLLIKEFPEISIAAKMEGHPNNPSQHAAGIIITEEPVAEYVAIDARTQSTMCDKKDSETLNLLKIDALGLTQLSIFERTLELIGEEPKSEFFDRIPLDDPAAFAVLNEKRFSGVFQFTGTALRSLTGQVAIERIEDIIAITALARPGPLASGGAMSWVKRKSGLEAVSTAHPMLTEMTKDTFGIPVYQETIMRIVREMGKMSWEDTSAIRKAMSGRLGDEFFARYKERFLAGASEHKIEPSIAEEVWSQINTMGSWCLAGETRIRLARKLKDGRREISIKELSELKRQNLTALSLCDDGRVRWQKIAGVVYQGEKFCNRYHFSDGSSVDCTPEHQFVINGNWSSVKEAKVGDAFLVASSQGARKSRHPKIGNDHFKGQSYKIAQEGFPRGDAHPRWKNGYFFYHEEFRKRMKGMPCEDCGKFNAKRMEAHHNDFCAGQERPRDLSWVCPSCHAIRHRAQGTRLGKGERGLATSEIELSSIESIGPKETYDLVMPNQHNFVLSNDIITHNSFNKSHAVAYGIVSYWSCWLKAHHPLAFAAATLDAEKEPSKQIALLKELNAEGVDYVPFDAELSTDRWEQAVKNGRPVLIGPLTTIKGIGPAMMREILDTRKSGKPLRAAVRKRLENATTEIDSLNPIADRIKAIVPDLTSVGIVSRPWLVKDVQPGIDGDVLILAVLRKLAPKDENEAVNVQKRGYRVNGPDQAINMFFADDTDEIFCKIGRFDYAQLAPKVLEVAKTGKSIFAIKGQVPKSFRMISVSQIKLIGEMG